MKSLYIDCSFGLSGDMLLAGFLDMGVPLDIIQKPINLLGFENSYSIKIEESTSFALRGIKVSIEDKELSRHSRRWVDIRRIIESSDLNDSLKERILNVFQVLAEAEATVHGIDIDKVHFHELGSVDSFVDIAGVCAAIEYLNPSKIIFDFPPSGSGFVDTEHGSLPVPVPAVLELAKRHQIKLISDQTSVGEMTTPTGLSLMAVLSDSFGRPTSFDIDLIGIGLGHKVFNRANFLRICILKPEEFPSNYKRTQDIFWEQVVIQETWIDDASSEDVSFLIQQLNNAGALEVVSTPIQMKKGRFGIALIAILKKEDLEKMRMIWFSYGTTIGLRERLEGRWVLNRRAGTCQTSFGEILVKQVRRPAGVLTIKAEHDELARISLANNVSIQEVRNEIELALDTFLPSEGWMF